MTAFFFITTQPLFRRHQNFLKSATPLSCDSLLIDILLPHSYTSCVKKQLLINYQFYDKQSLRNGDGCVVVAENWQADYIKHSVTRLSRNL